MAKGLRNVQLIRVGAWRGSAGETRFEVGDLEDIVRSYVALGSKTGFRPHLKLGHTDAQKFFGQRNGFPSLGEVTNVWRDGEVVYADIENVPEALLDLIEKRRYTQLSIEIYPSYEYEGVKYRNVLAAVALLGAELPAVKGLNDLAQALFKDEAQIFNDAQGKQEFTEMPATEKTQAEKDAEARELQSRIDAAVAAATSKLTTDLAAAQTANTALLARLDNTEKATRSARVAAIVDQGIKDGKIAPKSRDAFIAMGEAQAASDAKIKFGEGDKAVEKQGVEAFAATVEGLANVVELDEKGVTKVTKDDKSGGDKSAAERVDAMAQAAVQAGKAKTYTEAFAAVMADPANAELKAAYAAGE